MDIESLQISMITPDLSRPRKRKLGLSNLQVISGSGSMVLNFAPSRIFWHSFKETTGTASAAYQITDGLGGPIILNVSLSAGESTRDWFSEPALLALSSVYFKLISGSVEGVVSVALEEDYQDRFTQVEVMNFPGIADRVDTQAPNV